MKDGNAIIVNGQAVREEKENVLDVKSWFNWIKVDDNKAWCIKLERS